MHSDATEHDLGSLLSCLLSPMVLLSLGAGHFFILCVPFLSPCFFFSAHLWVSLKFSRAKEGSRILKSSHFFSKTGHSLIPPIQ